MAKATLQTEEIIREQISKSICVLTQFGKVVVVPENQFDSFLLAISIDKQLARDTIREVRRYRGKDLKTGNRILVQLIQGGAAVSQASITDIRSLMDS